LPAARSLKGCPAQAAASISCKSRTGAPISTSQIATLASPPASLLDGASLFLDFDGTLVDLADRPDQVVADEALRSLLAELNIRLGGRLAVISGRSIAQLDRILGPVAETLALSGSHGCEHRWDGIAAQPHRPPTLDMATARLRPLADRHPGALIEEKSYGVAFHYRLCPEVESEAVELARHVARELDLYLQDGKMMIELRVRGGDKGLAIRRMMALAPMKGATPVFIGDDRTDEPGFQAVAELGGGGIFVGEPRETAARYALPDPAAVRAWLTEALA
jgi:trehalose 6-phosphate phosphatase